jgi:hypothetical protein
MVSLLARLHLHLAVSILADRASSCDQGGVSCRGYISIAFSNSIRSLLRTGLHDRGRAIRVHGRGWHGGGAAIGKREEGRGRGGRAGVDRAESDGGVSRIVYARGRQRVVEARESGRRLFAKAVAKDLAARLSDDAEVHLDIWRKLSGAAVVAVAEHCCAGVVRGADLLLF